MNDNSLERRCSFNMAQGIPIAESTNLNDSGFSWGSVSPNVRRSKNFINLPSCSYLNDETVADSMNMQSISKVDARIAADVQSNGLASRIVKYQESGTRLNRSMSAHNLFSKTGQFPTVTLKKTNLPYRAAKRDVSMIRIPPPDKSSFSGSTVSSLLRSSSVIALQSKQNEDLSTENRPIIHPPPTENDMAPTRSVLDVLKEISRKRINSDDLESEETTKKYCSRSPNDFVDSVVNKISSVQEKYFASSRQRYKRQRDCLTSQQDAKLLDMKTSPQQDKKRICNYNNDIKSSLSSSIKCKKIQTFQNINQTFQLNEAQNSKGQQQYGHQKSYSKNDDVRSKIFENNTKKLETSEVSTGHEQNNSAITSQTCDSEPLSKTDDNTIYKPRLTLFNKKFDDNESKEENKTYGLEEKYEDDCTGIPFVKPKKMALNSGLRNPVIERTQKSKLALMLSGLRGELYQNSDWDELDSSCRRAKQEASETNKTNAITLTTASSANTATSANKVKATLLSTTPSPLVGLKIKSSSAVVSNMLSVDSSQKVDLQVQSNQPLLGAFSLCATSSSTSPPVQSCSNLKIESKSAPEQISVTPITDNTNTTATSSALFTSNDKISEISQKLQLPTSKNLTQLPSVCTAGHHLSTSNVNTAAISSALSIGKTFAYDSNLNNKQNDNSAEPNNVFPVPMPIVFGTSTAEPAKPIAFNISVPSTSSPILTPSSSAPIVFVDSKNLPSLTKTISKSISAVKSSSVDHKPVTSSETPFSTSCTSLLNFNTNFKSPTNEIEGYSERNKISNSVNEFGTNNNSVNLKPDAKSQNSGDENNKKSENKDFIYNSPARYESHFLNTKAEERSISVFDNLARTSDNNIFNSSGISSIFCPTSAKAGTEKHGSNSNNKTEVLITPTIYGNDKVSKSKSIPFAFDSNKNALAATNSSNVNTRAGGFSFSSAVSNSNESGSTGQTDTTNHTISRASALPSQNNVMFGPSSNKLSSSNIFGVSTNKLENLSQPGFSFGPVSSIKSPTFTFGGEKTSKSDTINANNSSASFSFGASTDDKQNVLPINKPFSFGSPQPIEQKHSTSSVAGNSFNIFGATNASKAAQPPAFQFTPGSIQSNAPTNIFAPPILSVTTGPADRPIRRATRRLQK